jgi:hypothetical protein
MFDDGKCTAVFFCTVSQTFIKMNTKTNEFVKTKVVARINETNILASQIALQLVPIRPICMALGVAYQRQEEKLKSHPVFSPSVTLRVTEASDGRRTNMLCLPIKYVFGWLFTIHPDNVKTEVRENLIQYQQACCDALFEYFFASQIAQQESIANTVTLRKRKHELEDKPDKSEDLTEYIDLTNKINQEKTNRRKNTKQLFSGMADLFENNFF